MDLARSKNRLGRRVENIFFCILRKIHFVFVLLRNKSVFVFESYHSMSPAAHNWCAIGPSKC